MEIRPKIRPYALLPAKQAGKPACLVHDPWGFSRQMVACPLPLLSLLPLCDGQHTPEEMHADLCQILGRSLPMSVTTRALEQLDAAGLLENAATRLVLQAAQATYRQHGVRQIRPNPGYPTDPAVLSAEFAAYSPLGADAAPSRPWRGLISPHIDYARGGPVYAGVWRATQAQAQAADLVIIFGTDHYGPAGRLTLTQLPYATPFGALPTEPALVDSLAQVLGPEAFALELSHQFEHAVELSANWLRYVRGETPVAMLPILCGPFEPLVARGIHPSAEIRHEQFIAGLRQLTARRRALAVASVDLSHVGPAFFTPAWPAAPLTEYDAGVREAILSGSAEKFYARLAETGNYTHICGFAPIYWLLRFLSDAAGVELAYQHCPAGADGQSTVSISGILLV